MALALGTTSPGYPAAVDDFNTARRQYDYSYVLPATLAAATLGFVGFYLLRPESPRLEGSVTADGRGGVLSASGQF